MFYLTLPSNSSMNYYPDNTLAHYTTALAQDVDLSGRWEVGLSEIQYPYSWHNMDNSAGWIIVHKDHQEKKLDLPPGQYDTPKQLIAGLNQLFTPAPPPYTARNMSQEPPSHLGSDFGPAYYLQFRRSRAKSCVCLSCSLSEGYYSSA